jgi:selenocysteine lyase/cysteine desulfurase
VRLRFVQKRLEAVRDQVAAYVNAPEDDVVLVENASGAVNAVLRSVKWKAGDSVLYLDWVREQVQVSSRLSTASYI